MAEASYALKLLQSEGRLSIASAGKDANTGRQQTQHYEVEGPVAMLLTTTAEEPDAELANRCLRLSVNEQPGQTAAIHQRQRAAYALEGAAVDIAAIRLRHQHAQRLLEPLSVVIPWAEQLTFRTDQTRMRRDHAKYLALIASLALLHQHQRPRVTRGHGDQAEACVVAAADDLRTANRLASQVLAARCDGLLPQTRQLLAELDQYVAQRSQAQAMRGADVRFTQRQVREALGWSDRALRRQLGRLVELEYVLVYRAGCGNQRVYQLLYDGQDGDGSPLVLGLADVERLADAKRAGAPGSDGSSGSAPAPIGAEPAACGFEPAGCTCEPAPIRRVSGGHAAACQNEVKPRRGKGLRRKPALSAKNDQQDAH